MSRSSDRLSMPKPLVVLPWGSMSTSKTELPSIAKEAPRFTAVVVLPTPPFWFTIAIVRQLGCMPKLGRVPVEGTRECAGVGTRAARVTLLAHTPQMQQLQPTRLTILARRNVPRGTDQAQVPRGTPRAALRRPSRRAARGGCLPCLPPDHPLRAPTGNAGRCRLGRRHANPAEAVRPRPEPLSRRHRQPLGLRRKAAAPALRRP